MSGNPNHDPDTGKFTSGNGSYLQRAKDQGRKVFDKIDRVVRTGENIRTVAVGAVAVAVAAHRIHSHIKQQHARHVFESRFPNSGVPLMSGKMLAMQRQSKQGR